MSTILITGGASGLGNAITRKFAKNPDNKVVFTYNKSVERANSITRDYSNTIALKCDFSVLSDVALLSKKINEINPDVLVNNAYCGSFLKTYFQKIPLDDFLFDFQNNIIPTVAITQAAITCFRKKKMGKIITILSSALSNIPPIGSTVYIANKAYLAELVKVWANENVKYNITSNSVSPAFMQTDFTSNTDERIIEQMINEHPLKRLLSPHEVAETVMFLATTSPQINGIDIVINAGQ